MRVAFDAREGIAASVRPVSAFREDLRAHARLALDTSLLRALGLVLAGAGGPCGATSSLDERRVLIARISSTARSNASRFAAEGAFTPLSFRTYCNADARISASVAGGSKWNKSLMLRHIREP